MADPWCTKDCEKCLRFERKACPGCKSGASCVRGGECEIAVCCQSRGFDNCGHCPEYVDCRMLDALDPIEHLEDPKPMRLPAATARKMANGMTALFALSLLLIVTSVMTMDSVAARWPALGEAGDMLAAVVGLAYYAVLLYMAGANTRYRRASFAGLAAVAVNVGALLISAGAVMAEAAALALLVSLAAWPRAITRCTASWTRTQGRRCRLPTRSQSGGGRYGSGTCWFSPACLSRCC